MKSARKTVQKIRNQFLKVSLYLMSAFGCLPAIAGKPMDDDIVKTLQAGAIGKTIGKEGAIWGLLIAVSFLVAAFHAASKSDPKAFIPAFVVTTLISTIIGYFLAF